MSLSALTTTRFQYLRVCAALREASQAFECFCKLGQSPSVVATGTPAEIQIHRALKRWAGTPSCAGASAPDYAVLFLTEVNHKAFQRLATHSAELRTRHPRTTFILVTPPHTQCDDRTIRKSEKLCKRGENRSALEAYDAAAVEAATPFDGVVVVPIGESTARGLSEGALRHEDTNPYHFHDAGRLFVLEMLLNAFAIAASRRPPH